MAKSLSGWYWHLGLASFIGMSGALADSFNCASAQITPDSTLPNNSIVTPQGNTSIIEGGTQAGSNLFHSFDEFSLPTGGEASFNNAANIQNILSRVTGGSVSNIDGLLRANGTANLFLLNPNGIIFGPNATLNIGGSFVGSTASSLNFADGTSFSATAPQTTPLLTISVPIGLQYGGNPGSIQVQGDGQGRRLTTELVDTTTGLRVEPNQTLALVGGNVALEGGTLKTAGGRIELGSVAEPSLVSLSPTEKGFSLGYESVPTFGDIQLSGAATVDASGAGGGDIQVQGRRVTLQDGSQIEASTLGEEPGGTLNVTAKESVEAFGISAVGQYPSALLAQVYDGATGAGGNLTIQTEQLILRDGAQVAAITFGTGAGGTLSVSASDVELIGTSANGQVRSGLFTQTQGDGDAGDMTIATGRLLVSDGAQVSASTLGTGAGGTLSVTASDAVEVIGTSANGQFGSGLLAPTAGEGDAGDMTIATGRLLVSDGAQVSAVTLGTGAGGTLSVTASDAIEVIGTSANGQFRGGLFTQTEGEGDAGDLTVATGRLLVRDGARISANTSGTGAGGTLSVTAADAIEVIGESADGRFGSALSAQTQGEGDAGDLTIATGRLLVSDGAQVSASTFGTGAGGTLSVTAADAVEVIGRSADGRFASGLYTRTQGEGDAGDLTIATGRLLVRDGAQVSTNTIGARSAGTLSVTASDAVEVIGRSADGRFGSGLFTSTSGEGDAGDLTIATGRLLVRDGSQVLSGTFGTGAGGTLSVTAADAIELIGESADGQINSGLFASTSGGGNAGDLTIATGRLLVSDGAQVSASTIGTGAGGTLSVTAADVIEVIGTTADGQAPSGLFAASQGEGDAGDLTIATGRLLVRDGSQVSTGTIGTGAGGTLSVTASNAVEVIGTSADGQTNSSLSAETEGEGNAGDLTIATGRLTVQDGAQVVVSSRGSGNAGNLEVTADSIRLDNLAFLSSDTPAGQGNIFLNSQDLVLRRGSNITTNATGTAEGGNITIDTDVLAAIENSDISADSDALGGEVIVTASGIFGTEYRDQQTSLSDITATGGTPELSGSVEINRLDVDPTQGLVELPAEIVDASNQIAQACPSGVREGKSKFIVTGRGGLPPDPHSPLTGEHVLTNLATLDNEFENISSAEAGDTNPTQVSASTTIVEATGWMFNKRGQVVLTATAPTAINIPWLPEANCNAPKPSSDS